MLKWKEYQQYFSIITFHIRTIPALAEGVGIYGVKSVLRPRHMVNMTREYLAMCIPIQSKSPE